MRHLIWIALAGVGCGGDTGALGQGEFGTCSAFDHSCSALPSAPVAAGASVPLVFDLDFGGASAPLIEVEAARPDIAAPSAAHLVGMAPGITALIVRGNGVVLDFIHVWVAQADRVALHIVDDGGHDYGEASEKLQLLAGDELYLETRFFAGAQALAGTAGCSWGVAGAAAAVSLLEAGAPGRVRLVAREPGLVTISADSLGLAVDLAVEVLP